MFNNFDLTDSEIFHIFQQYKPLIDNASTINFKFDEDLNQEILIYLYRVLSKGRRKN